MSGFEVIHPGVLCSIQDAGRKGVNDIGLTQSGAMDELSFGYANMLLGNAFNTSVIEIALGGLVLRAKEAISIAITGADMSPSIGGRSIEMWQTHTLKKGEELSFGFASSGHFAYVGVVGGFDIPLQYGSASTSIKEGLGGMKGRKLQAGDRLQSFGVCLCETRKLHQKQVPYFSQEIRLDVLKGYQEHLFDKSAQETFFNSVYTYKGEGDRMGYRLSGEKVIPQVSGILSEPICYGAIQVPSHGEPIVLLKERQTIGGYPKIGSILGIDCFKLAQLKPGGRIRFNEVSLEEARNKVLAFHTFFRF